MKGHKTIAKYVVGNSVEISLMGNLGEYYVRLDNPTNNTYFILKEFKTMGAATKFHKAIYNSYFYSEE